MTKLIKILAVIEVVLLAVSTAMLIRIDRTAQSILDVLIDVNMNKLMRDDDREV